jgi:hypothetical protein
MIIAFLQNRTFYNHGDANHRPVGQKHENSKD